METKRFSGLSETRRIKPSSFSNNIAVAALISSFAVCGCKNGNTSVAKDYPLKDPNSLSSGMDVNKNTPDVIDKNEDIAGAIESAGGSIHKQVNFNHGATVIFIADHHKDTSRPTADQYRVQNEIYNIVKNIVNSGAGAGSIPLVIENWPKGMSRSDFLSKLEREHPLYNLYSQPGNRVVATRLLDGSTANATTVLSGYYADKLYPVGTVNDLEMKEANKLIADDIALTELQNRNAEFCTLQNGDQVRPRAVKAAFPAQQDVSVNECYCALNYFETGIIERLRTRLSSIPHREAQITMREISGDSNGEVNTAIVVAGLLHMETVLSVFDDQKVNYIAVLPNTIKGNMEKLLGNDVFSADFPDDSVGTCQSLINGNKERILAIIEDIARI